MKLRIFTEPQQGASYADLLAVAQATEQLGFDAFFRSDHYLRMGEGSGLPGPSDAWISLAGLARETSRIRLGTLVSPATFRLPGPFAIALAQVDEMSGGRIELGLGSGWFEQEHGAYGIPFPDLATRFDVFSEQLAIIDGLWRTPAEQRYSFAGEHYTLADAPALPKPVQFPRPPIILGGAGKSRSAALAARYADEYNSGFAPVERVAEVFGRVRTAVADFGREADTMTYSIAQTTVVGRTEAEVGQRADAIGRGVEDLRSTALAGSPDEIVDQIGRYAAIGASTVYLQIMDLSDLDQLELLASAVLPQLT
ncbi:LLM class F420-dependent oxidoreductase [Jatrophihabitans telluris]|uniref:LLM class F420-dependent oxidoreductase n=1 Tax=Jatrophihabitans telluris TaxID=2038343 RepID=A0ABY4QY08_9ACTN|nr:LLM class F420-dependent oxidoreductase [Jatrophihabitans telluris]UQX88385.1 LLM class F420-dependent oxidoreductase [Jatrophihabitans telluris]